MTSTFWLRSFGVVSDPCCVVSDPCGSRLTMSLSNGSLSAGLSKGTTTKSIFVCGGRPSCSSASFRRISPGGGTVFWTPMNLKRTMTLKRLCSPMTAFSPQALTHQYYKSKQNNNTTTKNIYIYINMYIYTYMYICTYVYIYIYVYISQASL